MSLSFMSLRDIPACVKCWRDWLSRSATKFVVKGHPQVVAKCSTEICVVRFRASQRSCAICIPSQVSGVEPNAFDRRIAISMEMPVRSLMSSESAWRVTPKPLAARVTESPRGSRHCLFTIPPGCGGFCMTISNFLNDSPRNQHRQPTHPQIGKLLASSRTLKPHNNLFVGLSIHEAGVLADPYSSASYCDQEQQEYPPVFANALASRAVSFCPRITP